MYGTEVYEALVPAASLRLSRPVTQDLLASSDLPHNGHGKCCNVFVIEPSQIRELPHNMKIM